MRLKQARRSSVFCEKNAPLCFKKKRLFAGFELGRGHVDFAIPTPVMWEVILFVRIRNCTDVFMSLLVGL